MFLFFCITILAVVGITYLEIKLEQRHKLFSGSEHPLVMFLLFNLFVLTVFYWLWMQALGWFSGFPLGCVPF